MPRASASTVLNAPAKDVRSRMRAFGAQPRMRSLGG